MLEVHPSTLQFDEVAVNDIPSYRKIRILNKEAERVVVHLSVNVPCVYFQLENENYYMLKSRGPSELHASYNGVFDSIGLITSLEFEGGEARDVIASFRGDVVNFSHFVPQSGPIVFTGTIQLTATSAVTTNSSLFMSGGSFSSPITEVGRQGSFFASSPTVPTTVRSEVCSLVFRGSVFLSCIQVSTTELQATMAPNKTQIVEFTVTNISSRPVPFVVRSQTIPNKAIELALYEAERFEEPKLGHRLLLDSQASMNLSLMVRTTASSNSMQQYQAVLQCDNLRDSRNSVAIYLNVNIAAESQGDMVSTSDTSIDFGNVYRGTSAKAVITFSNIDTREDATVRLSAVNRRKCEGDVRLLIDEKVLDEIVVPAQKKAVAVTIMYKPTLDEERKETSKVKFDLEFQMSASSGAREQRVVVRCSATLFTSTIIVSQSNVNFGDCQVGQSKRYTFNIDNLSPLPGNVIVQLRSKIISIEGVVPRQSVTTGSRETREEFSIAPTSSLPITLRIAPQRVNPTYRKQLTIINASNPEDRQIINIEANNVAQSEAKLHNELYSWECCLPASEKSARDDTQHALCAITNVPLLVPYIARSKVDRPLVLNISSTSTDIEALYCSDEGKADQIEAVAAELRSYCNFTDKEDANRLANSASAARVTEVRHDLVTLLAEMDGTVTSVTLEPYGSAKVFALILRSHFSTEMITKEDALTIAVEDIEVPRFVRLSYRLCGSFFELAGQKTKNYGEVNIGVKKVTKLQLINQCKSVLYLRLTKSRSVTAGHIRIDNSEKQCIFMCIRPYATKEIELSFYPGIKGEFNEKIRVVNLLRPENDTTITLKATVTKADTFDVSPDTWSFGVVQVPATTDPVPYVRVGAKFMVFNTSKTGRQIRLRLDTSNSSSNAVINSANTTADGGGGGSTEEEGGAGDSGTSMLCFQGVDVQMHLDMELCGASSGSSRKIEEQIEKLEQKLKIYKRKKKVEKMQAAQKRIETLKRALLGEEVDLDATECANAAEHDLSESEDESMLVSAPAGVKNRFQHSELMSLLLGAGVPLPVMGAGESVTIVFGLTCTRIAEEPLPEVQTNTVNLLLFEAKDQEVNRIFPIDITLVRPEGETGSPVGLGGVTQAFGGISSSPGAITGNVNASLVTASQQQQQQQPSCIFLEAGENGRQDMPSLASQQLTTTAAAEVRATAAGVRAGAQFMGQPLLVLRNCIVNDSTEFTILVTATRSTTIVVLEPRRCAGPNAHALDARFKFYPRNGVVRADEALRIVVECSPKSVGPQKYFVPVKNIQNAADVKYFVVEMNPTEEEEPIVTEPKQLTFSPIVTPPFPRTSRYSSCESQLLLIRSRFPYPHALLVRTNKPSQVYLFEDAQCTIPLANPIQRTFMKETIRVYVQFRPSPKACQHDARVVEAGIVIEAITTSSSATAAMGSASSTIVTAATSAASTAAGGPYCIVGKAAVKVSVLVGSGTFIVPTTHIHLASVEPTDRQAVADFYIINPSHRYLITARAIPLTPNIVVSSANTTPAGTPPPHSVLIGEGSDIGGGGSGRRPQLLTSKDPTVTEAREWRMAPREERVLSVTIRLPQPGLYTESVLIQNLSCDQPAIRVVVSVLRRDAGVSAQVPSLVPLAQPFSSPVDKLTSFVATATITGAGGSMTISPPPPPSPLATSLPQERLGDIAVQRTPLPALTFPIVAVARGEDGALHLCSTVSASIDVRSHCTRDFILVAESDTLSLIFGDQPQRTLGGGAAGMEATPAGRRVSSCAHASSSVQQPYHTMTTGRVHLEAQQSKTVPFTLTEMPELDEAQVATIVRHGVATVRGLAQVIVAQVVDATPTLTGFNLFRSRGGRAPVAGQCVLLVPMVVSFALSEGYCAPTHISLGTVGIGAHPHRGEHHEGEERNGTGWEGETERRGGVGDERAEGGAPPKGTRDGRPQGGGGRHLHHSANASAPISMRLHNLSRYLPLYLSIECQPIIRLSSSLHTGGGKWLVVAPGHTLDVEAQLQLSLIPKQGPFEYGIFFVNQLNAENDIAVTVNGQYYWKVFQIFQHGSDEEVSGSMSMPSSLRVDPSSAVPFMLSEAKLTVKATEQNVRLGMRVSHNPKLEGIVQLQLLHYDATPVVDPLTFRPQSALTVASVTTTTTGEPSGTAGGNSSSNAISAGGGIMSSDGGVGTDQATSGNSGALANPTSNISTAITNNTSSGGGGGVGNASSSTATPAPGCGIDGISTHTNNNNNNSSVAVNEPGSANVVVSTTTNATPPAATPAAASVVIPTHTLRLRCVLTQGDLAYLSRVFFGGRRRQAQQLRELASWSFERLPELEEKRKNEQQQQQQGIASPSVWLGTVTLYNQLTDDEEIDIFGTLDPFNTFSAPSKAILTPARLAPAAGEKPPAEEAEIVYVGDYTVTNPCHDYTCTLALRVLFSTHLTVPITVEVSGGMASLVATTTADGGEGHSPTMFQVTSVETPPPQDNGSSLNSGAKAARTVFMNSASQTGAPSLPSPSPPSTMPPLQPALAHATATTASTQPSLAPTAPPSTASFAQLPSLHRFSIGPGESCTLHFLVRGSEADGGSMKAVLRSSLEKFIAVMAVDEGVPSNVSISRVSVAVPGGGASGGNSDGRIGMDEGDELEPMWYHLQTVNLAAFNEESSKEDTTHSLHSVAKSPGDASAHRDNASTLSSNTNHDSGNAFPPIIGGEGVRKEAVGEPTPAAAAPSGGSTRPSTNALPAQGQVATKEEAGTSGDGAPLPQDSTTDDATDKKPGTQTVLSPSSAGAISVVPSQVISLKNCTPVPGCTEAYSSSFSFPKGEAPATEIGIRNNLSDRSVEYSVAVTSQGPQPWLLLPSSMGSLGAGETQTLRLNILSTDVGSFVGYLAISNSLNPCEVVYLRLAAEIFTRSTGEDLAEVLAFNGQRVTSNAACTISMGHLYGRDASRVYIALEIVNRGRVALEFPVSVVEPIRLELKPMRDAAALKGGQQCYHHHNHYRSGGSRPHSAAPYLHSQGQDSGKGQYEVSQMPSTTVAATVTTTSTTTGSSAAPIIAATPNIQPATGAAAGTTTSPSTLSRVESASVLEDGRDTAQTSKVASTSDAKVQRRTNQSEAAATKASINASDGTTVITAEGTTSSTTQSSQLASANATTALCPLQQLPQTSSSSFKTARIIASPHLSPGIGVRRQGLPFEGKLVVCHIHGVPTRTGHKYFVVDPKSRVRLAFVLTCTDLAIPEGYFVAGEADIVFKCKQARDANYTFHAAFEAYAPTFGVQREYFMMSSAAVAAASRVKEEEEEGEEERTGKKKATSEAGGGGGDASNHREKGHYEDEAEEEEAEFAACTEARVEIYNHLAISQCFAFRTQSPVLYVLPGTGTRDGDEAAAVANPPPHLTNTLSSSEIEVPAYGKGYFSVRLDRLRAAALLNYDKDNAEQPILCEHAFILNVRNPEERVRLEFHQGAGGDREARALNRQQRLLQLQQQQQQHPSFPGSTHSRSSAARAAVATMVPAAAWESKSSRNLGTMIKPVKAGGQHISEHYIMRFVQQFSSTLTKYMDRLLAMFSYYESRKEMGAAGMTVPASVISESSSSNNSSNRSSRSGSSNAYSIESGQRRNPSGRQSRGSASVEDATDRIGGGVIAERHSQRGVLVGDVRGDVDDTQSDPLSSTVNGSSATAVLISRHRDASGTLIGAAAAAVVAGSGGGGSSGAPSTTVAVAETKLGLSTSGWGRLHDLLLELIWLVDELVFYAILLRNSRLIEGYCIFITSAVCNHPVMKAWRQHKDALPAVREYSVFAQLIQALDALPCATLHS